MRVSIAIPFYNASEFITQTLDSVKNQDYPDIELLLYDDYSIDNSSTIVKEWLDKNSNRFIRYLFMQGTLNKGASFGADVLLKNSTGYFFQMLGGDDILLPTKISSQVLFLLANTSFSMVYSNVFRINAFGNRLPENYFEYQKFDNVESGNAPSGYLYDKLIHENFIPASSFLAVKVAIIDSGGYDPCIRSEDWDLWLRFSKNYQIGYMNAMDVEYRIHDNSSMQNKANLGKIFESFLITLYKHYGYSRDNDKIILNHINKYTVGMYRLGVIDYKFLLKNFYLNRSLKSLFYLILGFFKIKTNQVK